MVAMIEVCKCQDMVSQLAAHLAEELLLGLEVVKAGRERREPSDLGTRSRSHV